MTQENITMLSLAAAGISLILSFTTLYFSYFRAPKIQASAGPFIKIYYSDYNIGGGTGFYLPATFFNSSARSAVVTKTAIEIHNKANEHKRFLIFGGAYSELNIESNSWKNKEIAHALPILGRSAIHKTIRYYWSSNNSDKLIFEEGIYEVKLIFWVANKEKPLHVEHELVIDSEMINKLNGYRESKKSTTVDIMMDREIANNKFLSLHESKKLLGQAV